MKRNFSLLFFIFTLCWMLPPELKAQSAPVVNSLKTSEYILTDINGNKYDLDATLKSGRFVLIDFSTVWCYPCWDFHRGGYLERINQKFGPNGTNQIDIFWVEEQGAKTDLILGINNSTTGEIETCGNWTLDVNGNPVPYPVVSDAKLSNTLGIPVSDIPSLVLIGPGKEWAFCRDEVETSDLEFKELLQLMTHFTSDADKPLKVSFTLPEGIQVGEQFVTQASFSTVAPITSYQWSAPKEVTFSAPNEPTTKISSSKAGVYEIVLEISNKNGTTTRRKNLYFTPENPVETFPFICGFDDAAQTKTDWRSIDLDFDGYGFEYWSVEADRIGDSPIPGALKSKDFLVSWGKIYPIEITPEGQMKFKEIEADNMLVSRPIKIDANASKPLLSFFIQSAFDALTNDCAKVLVSTSKELTKEAFTTEIMQSGEAKVDQWALVQADLSAYKGQTIRLAIVPVVNGPSGLMVDQIGVSMDGSTVNIDQPTVTHTSLGLYPNPANLSVSVVAPNGSKIEIFNAAGQLMYSGRSKEVATNHFPNGRYLVRTTSAEGTMQTGVLMIEH